jgi:hypothetical protein
VIRHVRIWLHLGCVRGSQIHITVCIAIIYRVEVNGYVDSLLSLVALASDSARRICRDAEGNEPSPQGTEALGLARRLEQGGVTVSVSAGRFPQTRHRRGLRFRADRGRGISSYLRKSRVRDS